MRCIETVPYGFDAPNIKSINRNMRCIETFKTVFQTAKADWLIETWDVLKQYSSSHIPALGQD